jgi:hypothetical protein
MEAVFETLYRVGGEIILGSIIVTLIPYILYYEYFKNDQPMHN